MSGVNREEPKHLEMDVDIEGKAALLHTGWDGFWKKEKYFSHPFVTRELAEYMVEKRVKLVGIDTINIDKSQRSVQACSYDLVKKQHLDCRKFNKPRKVDQQKIPVLCSTSQDQGGCNSCEGFCRVNGYLNYIYI